MVLVYSSLNNKGLPNQRPWRIESKTGVYINSFKTKFAAFAFLMARAR